MGKGDRRTKRGKIFRNSYGKSRPKKRNRVKVSTEEKPESSES